MKLFPIILTLAACAGAATNYYIAPTGSDIANGTSTSTPWEHCPGDTAFKGSYTHANGDSMIFESGVTYAGCHINLNYSYINYKGSRVWGAGQDTIGNFYDILTAYGQYGMYVGVSDSFVTIDNFCFTKMGGATGIDSANPRGKPSFCASNVGAQGYPAYGIYVATSIAAHDFKIKNCTFLKLGWWQTYGGSTCDYGANPTIQGDGIFWNCYNTKNILIDSCDFNRVGNAGIVLWLNSATTSQNIETSHCTIHDYVRWGIDVGWATTGSGIKDLRIHDNSLYNFYMYDPANWVDTCVRNYPGHNAIAHTDFIVLQIGGGYTNLVGGDVTTPIKIYNNDFWTDTTVGGGTALIFCPGGQIPGELWFYNNVIKNDLQAYGWLYIGSGTEGVTPPSHLLIANNTGYQNGELMAGYGALMGGQSVSWEMYNNINCFESNSFGFAYSIKDSQSIPTYGKINNNLWYSPRTDSLALWIYNPASHYVAFNAIKTYGFDSSSVWAYPKFSDTTHGLNVNSHLNNLHLLAGSPAIGIGKNLSAYFTTDKDGNTRPPAGAWDVGAYQYTTYVPSAKKALRVRIGLK